MTYHWRPRACLHGKILLLPVRRYDEAAEEPVNGLEARHRAAERETMTMTMTVRRRDGPAGGQRERKLSNS